MSNPTKGAETMTAGQPIIRKAVFEIASRRIKSGAPGLAPATAEAIARIIGLEAATSLASPRADSEERAVGDVLKEACKPWEHYTGELPDDGSPLSGVFVAGMVYTERLLAKLLDVTHYEGGDGSEDFDADATQTLRNILTGARLWDADENRPASATPAQPAGAVPDSLRDVLMHAYYGVHDEPDLNRKSVRISCLNEDGALAVRNWLLDLRDGISTHLTAHPAVPDSLRALAEAASEDWDTNEATPYILGPPIDGEIDRFEVIARAPHGYAKNGDDIRKWQANRMFAVAAVNFVRTLLATHPAGQSAGSGAEEPKAHSMKLSGRPSDDMLTGVAGWLTQMRDGADNLGDQLKASAALYAVRALLAPDSTRTGAKCPEVITLTRTQYNEHYYSGYADGMKDGQGICEAALAARPPASSGQEG